MALRSGYKGIKKLAAGLKWNRPGILAADDTALAKVFFPRSEQAVLGVKNRWNFPAWKGVGLSDATATWDDDTYTITLTSTDTAGRTEITVPTDAQINVVPNEKIKFVWDSTGTSADGVMTFDVYKVEDTSAPIASAGVRDNELIMTVPANCYKLTYRVLSGSADKILKMANCMCVLASDMDKTFAPYAMTNKQLTDKASVKTIAHATAITESDLSVTFTEYITGNVEQIVGVISSSVDKDIASQSGISIGTALAHKPLSSAEVIGSIDSSLSASDRRPICSIRISNTGRISIDGQMSANRNYTFTITYIFGS